MPIKREVAEGIFAGLANHWKDSDFHDFLIKVEDVQFGCHRVILAASSDFFSGLFRSGMKETSENSVTLKDISSDTFALIRETLYSGHSVLTNDNVIDIWKAVHQLQIHFLVSECEHFIINTFSEENYADYFFISNTLNSAVVLETLWPFVLKNCSTFLETRYFLHLPFGDVLRLIKSQDLETGSEDDVIYAILEWVEFQNDQSQAQFSSLIADSDQKDLKQDYEGGSGAEKCVKKIDNNDTSIVGNKFGNSVSTESLDILDVAEVKEKSCDHLLILLSHARLCLASQRCLQSLVIHPLVSDNKEIRDIVFDALLYRAGNRNGQWPSRAVHRNHCGFIHCLVVARNRGNDVVISAYSLAEEKWRKLPGLVEVGTTKLATVDNQLYALCAEITTSSLSCFQLEKGTWSQVNVKLECQSTSFHCAVVDSCVYIFSTQERLVLKLWITKHIVQRIYGSRNYKNISYTLPYDQWILVFYHCADARALGKTRIRRYDTSRNSWQKLNKLEGPAKGMTTFKDDHFTYILQCNGKLWKVFKPQSDTIDFELVTKLWSLDWILYGAVTFMDELYIHGDFKDDSHIKRSLPGAFCKIHYLENKYPENSLPGGLPIILARNIF